MDDTVDISFGLRRRGGTSYYLELHQDRRRAGADAQLRLPEDVIVRLDEQVFLPLRDTPQQYGQALSAALLDHRKVRDWFIAARGAATAESLPLRVQIDIHPNAANLQALYWECLCDPESGEFLTTGQRVYFSRYLSSSDQEPIKLRRREELRALAVIANPSDLAHYSLAPIPLADHKAVLKALRPFKLAVLAEQARPTLPTIVGELRKGYDIVYLVCHGRIIDDNPVLALEDERGLLQQVPGGELAVRIKELNYRPRLVVLVSCSSAGEDEHSVLSSMAARLAEAGVPAVVAVQSVISQATIAQVMPVFFQELTRDGKIDRALAVARGTARYTDDAWALALFSRLKGGSFWYTPGFSDGGFEKWPKLLSSIDDKYCMPILGPGLLEPLIGDQREIARRWAQRYNFPLAPQAREDLPRVAQYLAVTQDRAFLLHELNRAIRFELEQRFDKTLSTKAGGNVSAMLKLAWVLHVRRTHRDPYWTIANLGLPIYVTTSIDGLLPIALKAARRNPLVLNCPWNAYTVQRTPDPDLVHPTPEAPLVYQLFGSIDEPESLVLTEDDYFRFLIGAANNRNRMPHALLAALVDRSLLFLGFRLDNWDFRALFQSVMTLEGEKRRDHYSHVAAQIEPEIGPIIEPASARRYLESSFNSENLSIYWGSVEEFADELHTQLASLKES